MHVSEYQILVEADRFGLQGSSLNQEFTFLQKHYYLHPNIYIYIRDFIHITIKLALKEKKAGGLVSFFRFLWKLGFSMWPSWAAKFGMNIRLMRTPLSGAKDFAGLQLLHGFQEFAFGTSSLFLGLHTYLWEGVRSDAFILHDIDSSVQEIWRIFCGK